MDKAEHVVACLADNTQIQQVLASTQECWYVEKELSGGNINFLYILASTMSSDKVLVKFVPSFIKIVPYWPLDPQRIMFEHEYMVLAGKHAPLGMIPILYDFVPEKNCILMEYVAASLDLRHAMLKRMTVATLGHDLGCYLAKTLFFTSDLYLPFDKKQKLVQEFAKNTSVCLLTLQVIFDEPYRTNCKNNSWCHGVRPSLDERIAAMQQNDDIHARVALLRDKFTSSTQALVHGDLHSGSILVQGNRVVVIDYEFAFFSSMGFDVGMVLANFAIALIAHYHAADYNDKYGGWIVEQACLVWSTFCQEMLSLMNTTATRMLPESYKQTYLRQVEQDTLQFASLEMIRRMVGIASCADTEAISNKEKQAEAEEDVLQMGIDLLMGTISNVQDWKNHMLHFAK